MLCWGCLQTRTRVCLWNRRCASLSSAPSARSRPRRPASVGVSTSAALSLSYTHSLALFFIYTTSYICHV